jgi:hypothetical protein
VARDQQAIAFVLPIMFSKWSLASNELADGLGRILISPSTSHQNHGFSMQHRNEVASPNDHDIQLPLFFQISIFSYVSHHSLDGHSNFGSSLKMSTKPG